MPRTGENIYQRKDGRWEARCLCEITGKYQSLYAKSYTEVKRKKTEFLSRQLHMVQTSTTTATVAEAAVAWLVSVNFGVKESTFAKYSRTVRLHITPAFPKCKLAKINQTQMELFAQSLINKGLSSKTARDVLTIFKQILKHSNAERHIDFSKIKLKSEHKEMRVFTRAEQNKLCKYLTHNADAAKLGVLLSLYTGIRIGELCALRWEDIDLTAKTLRVEKTMQRIDNLDGVGCKTKIVITDPKSNSSLRIIPLPDFLVPMLKAQQKNPQAYVLTAEKLRWMEPRTLQYRFKSMLKKAGVADANYHCTRHSFASRAVELGVDVKTLSEILGHSKIEITLSRYVHSSFDLKRECMDKMNLLCAA